MSEEKQQQNSKPVQRPLQQDGLALVMMRNDFYRDKYRTTVLIFLVSLVLVAMLAWHVFYTISNPPEPQYFAATNDGRIIQLHPLSDPVVDSSYVLQWTTNAVREAFELDFEHWREQLQRVSQYFSPIGWKWFLSTLKSTNNLKTLSEKKMVSSATVTGAPQILEQAVISGHYVWKISLPLLVTYANSGNRTINMPLMVTVVVIREPVQNYPARIAINNFIGETRAA